MYPTKNIVRNWELVMDELLGIVCAGQVALDRGRELAVVEIDFRAVLDP